MHEFRRRELPFLRTIVDAEIVREIGLHETTGDALTLKTLFLQGIASAATVQRRLARLKQQGIVLQQRAEHDKRTMVLTLSPRVRAAYVRMGRMLRNTLN